MKMLRRFVPDRVSLAFLKAEAAGGVVMIGAAMLAILAANSGLANGYQALLTYPLLPHMDLSLFTKDVLMAIFFFTVGMELKHEMTEGALSAPGQKLLPLLAALGGIAIPALLYLAITHGQPQLRAGWAIPTATDIAFALCVLQLVGKAVPHSAKMFLLAIAIYDDLAAILIIAFFYSTSLSLPALGEAAAILAAMAALNRWWPNRLAPFLLLGAALWTAVHHAGIHPTVAGVLTGILIPHHTRQGKPMLSPLLHRLHPWVAFGVLPLFAFTSAGLPLADLTVAQAFGTLPLAIALALFFGKQAGIFFVTRTSVAMGLASLPEGMNAKMLYGISILAGIGFTMSLFIGSLAFPDTTHQHTVTLGVLMGTLLSAFWGFIFLKKLRP